MPGACLLPRLVGRVGDVDDLHRRDLGVGRVPTRGSERCVVAEVAGTDEVEARARPSEPAFLGPIELDHTGTGFCTGFVVNVMFGMS